jgi:hypothetical protein
MGSCDHFFLHKSVSLNPGPAGRLPATVEECKDRQLMPGKALLDVLLELNFVRDLSFVTTPLSEHLAVPTTYYVT